MTKPSLTNAQRRASSLLEAAVTLVTLLPLGKREEMVILQTHLDELLDYIVEQYDQIAPEEREFWDTIRDLALAIYRVVRCRLEVLDTQE